MNADSDRRLRMDPVLHEFLGTIESGVAAKRRAWLQISHGQFEPSGIKCVLLLQEPLSPRLRSWNSRELAYRADVPKKEEIHMYGPIGYSASSYRAELDVRRIDIGCTSDSLPADADVSGWCLLNAGAALRSPRIIEKSFTGSIDVSTAHGAHLEWRQDVRTYQASLRAEYAEIVSAGKKILVQSYVPSLAFTQRTDGKLSMRDLMETLDRDLSDVLPILSLASRESVDWFETEVMVVKAMNDQHAYHRGFRRAVAEHREEISWPGPLLSFTNLRDGGLGTLVSAFQKSAIKEALRHAIAFEVESRSSTTIEARLFLAHAALEAVAWALCLSDPNWKEFGKSSWKRFAKGIKKSIKALAAELQLDPALSVAATKKIRELSRPPVKDVIESQVTRLNVKIDDVWPRDLGFSAGLAKAIKDRNDLVHEAKISNFDRALMNAARLQILAERLILKVLEWPDDHVWSGASDEVNSVNSPGR